MATLNFDLTEPSSALCPPETRARTSHELMTRPSVHEPQILRAATPEQHKTAGGSEIGIGSPYRIPGLTPRESEIAVYVALGYKNPEISQKAGISHQTVKNHLSAIYRSLQLKRREDLEPIVYTHIPQVREEMLRLGRAPQKGDTAS